MSIINSYTRDHTFITDQVSHVQPPTVKTKTETLVSLSFYIIMSHLSPQQLVDIGLNASISHLAQLKAHKPQQVVSHIFPPPFHLPIEASHWPAQFHSNINEALLRAWAPATRKNYNSGINRFLSFCRKHNIHANHILPSNEFLLCAFVANISTHLTTSTIKNTLSALRAWHIEYGFDFPRSERLLTLARSASQNLTAKPRREPVTIDLILALHQNLVLHNTFDLAVFACALTAFWGLARLGELLPLSKNSDLSLLPSRSSVTFPTHDTLSIHLPWTKTKRTRGDDIQLSPQMSVVDPISILQLFFRLNPAQPSDPLFAFQDTHGKNLLLRPAFLTRCNQIWTKCGLPNLTGHSFRIGGASHLLRCGVHPDVVKKMGRWSSDSFLVYWRNLNLILPNHVRFLPIHSSSLGVSRGLPSAAAMPLSGGKPQLPAVQHRASKGGTR